MYSAVLISNSDGNANASFISSLISAVTASSIVASAFANPSAAPATSALAGLPDIPIFLLLFPSLLFRLQ